MGLELLWHGFGDLFTWANLLAMVFGVLVGGILGAIPGLTSIMGVALILPYTYAMPLETAVIMMLAAFKGGNFGGSISAIVLGTPGTPSAAATALDGYKLAQAGKAEKALQTALLSSAWGELFSSIIAVMFTIHLARLALKLGPGEYGVLILFALTAMGSLAGRSFAKGILSGLFGMALAMIGTDPSTSNPRFAFGSLELSSGLDVLAVMIGLLAFSEILMQVEKGVSSSKLPSWTAGGLGKGLTWQEIRQWAPAAGLGSVIGTVVGAIPALGPPLSAFLAYDQSRNVMRGPVKLGEGALEGVAAPESANNATNGGALLTLLGLGIPGDLAMAVLAGAFMIHGVPVGPFLFRERPETVGMIFAGMILATFLMVIVFWPLLRLLARIASVRASRLIPVVIVLIVVGSYAFNQRPMDVWLMIIMGVVGYLMYKFHFSPPALLIGFILGPIFENNVKRALLISGGDFGIFFGSPVTWLFWVLTALSLYVILRRQIRMEKEQHQKSQSESRMAKTN